MTGIIISYFKDNVYVFSDGLVTDNGIVIDEKFTKTHKKNNKILTFTGGCGVATEVLELFNDNKEPTYENIKTLEDEGAYTLPVIVDEENITEYWLESDRKTKTMFLNKVKYKHNNTPHFYGSGGYHLEAAYLALNLIKPKSEKEFLDRIRKAYKVASYKVTSMNNLYKYEKIKVK